MKDKMMQEDDDVENVGIMQGFMDSMSEDDDESEDEEDDQDSEDSAERITRDRRPDAPEILMNNLRGDMRSIDARRDELADLVGYAAACETPDSVLAMLQPVLAAQAQGAAGGIGALPPSAEMAQGPQPPMPPQEMPPAAPEMPSMEMAPPAQDGGIASLMAQQGAPSMPEPAQFARGGLVQGFAEGSDEDGVTPMQEPPSSDFGIPATPEMVERARAQFAGMLSQQPTAVPDLRVAAEERAKLYRDILGDNTQAQQAQMLMNLGQRAFGFAANVDDQGRALRGSFLSRLAGATRTLPGEMAQYIAATDEQQRKARMLGLQAAEKDVESIRTANLKLLETQRKGYVDILKADAKAKGKSGSIGAGPFGGSLPGRSLQIMVDLAPGYARGELDDTQRNVFMAAVTDYTQETKSEVRDPLTGETRVFVNRNQLPDFAQTALRTAGSMPPASSKREGSVAPVPSSVASIPPSVAPSEPVVDETPTPVGDSGSSKAPKAKAESTPKTLFELAATGTGFFPVLTSKVAGNLPFDVAGRIRPEFQQGVAQISGQKARIVNALQESPRFSDSERQQIDKELSIEPSMRTSEEAFINRLVAVDNTLQSILDRTNAVANNPKTGMDARRDAFKKLSDIAQVRKMVGVVQQKVHTPEQWKTLPPGRYLVLDPDTGAYVLRPKYK